MDQQFIVCPSVDASRLQEIDDWKRVCQTFNAIGARAKEAGLRLRATTITILSSFPSTGKSLTMLSLAETDPDLVKMEADLYWMTKAGRDPVSYFQKYPGRFPFFI